MLTLVLVLLVQYRPLMSDAKGGGDLAEVAEIRCNNCYFGEALRRRPSDIHRDRDDV